MVKIWTNRSGYHLILENKKPDLYWTYKPIGYVDNDLVEMMISTETIQAWENKKQLLYG